MTNIYTQGNIQMLKSLWLSILGWFRTKAEENVDLRYAGKEQFARNEASIENVRKQRNSLAGDHLLLKKRIAETSTKVDEATTAFQHWTDDGDLLKGTWNDEHGSFEPAFDAKGNIIAFNLINKP